MVRHICTPRGSPMSAFKSHFRSAKCHARPTLENLENRLAPAAVCMQGLVDHNRAYSDQGTNDIAQVARHLPGLDAETFGPRSAGFLTESPSVDVAGLAKAARNFRQQLEEPPTIATVNFHGNWQPPWLLTLVMAVATLEVSRRVRRLQPAGAACASDNSATPSLFAGPTGTYSTEES